MRRASGLLARDQLTCPQQVTIRGRISKHREVKIGHVDAVVNSLGTGVTPLFHAGETRSTWLTLPRLG